MHLYLNLQFNTKIQNLKHNFVFLLFVELTHSLNARHAARVHNLISQCSAIPFRPHVAGDTLPGAWEREGAARLLC